MEEVEISPHPRFARDVSQSWRDLIVSASTLCVTPSYHVARKLSARSSSPSARALDDYLRRSPPTTHVPVCLTDCIVFISANGKNGIPYGMLYQELCNFSPIFKQSFKVFVASWDHGTNLHRRLLLGGIRPAMPWAMTARSTSDPWARALPAWRGFPSTIRCCLRGPRCSKPSISAKGAHSCYDSYRMVSGVGAP